MMYFDELAAGDSAEFTKTVTETDVVLYAGITGDLNPAHVDEVSASAGRFGGRIAHGMLVAGFISTVLGTRLPGPGTIYLSQSLRFVAPVRLGDTVTARVEVAELLPKRRARLATTVRNQRGETVVEGEATVMVPARPEAAE
ncbi:MAG TPA: MaoC family dehydratase [Longimicrobium sp.]|nr:MaoC family dehydratase [Longimicrobium sp.]